MIEINFNNIHINNASDKSGVFIGYNFNPGWSTYTKSNTNVSGNKVSDSINIILDNDEYDFTVVDKDDTNEVIVSKTHSISAKKKSQTSATKKMNTKPKTKKTDKMMKKGKVTTPKGKNKLKSVIIKTKGA